jgi:NADH:ubiquinone oxidoreductase subunit D
MSEKRDHDARLLGATIQTAMNEMAEAEAIQAAAKTASDDRGQVIEALVAEIVRLRAALRTIAECSPSVAVALLAKEALSS